MKDNWISLILFTVFSALLLQLAFPPFSYFWLAPFALMPLLWVIRQPRKLLAQFGLGFLFGCTLILGYTSWMWSLRAFAPLAGVLFIWLSFGVFQGVFYGAWAVVTHLLETHPVALRHPSRGGELNVSLDANFPLLRRGARRAGWVLPITWALMEYVRSLGPLGNTAAALGYSMATVPAFAKSAVIWNVFGVSGLIVLIACVLPTPSLRATPPQEGKIWLSALLIVGIAFWHVLPSSQATPEPSLKVAIIQENHPQLEKINPHFWESQKSHYLALMAEAAKQRPDVVLMSEAILPVPVYRDLAWVATATNLAKEHDTAFLFGSNNWVNDRLYNSIFKIDRNGLDRSVYHKIHLMPFGEYIPIHSVANQLGIAFLRQTRDFSSGKPDQPLLNLGGLHFGIGICLEGMDPAPFRRTTQNGAGILYLAANNAWFSDSKAAAQLLSMCQLRAIENQRYFLLVANTGISAVIDSKGHVRRRIPLNTEECLFVQM